MNFDDKKKRNLAYIYLYGYFAFFNIVYFRDLWFTIREKTAVIVPFSALFYLIVFIVINHLALRNIVALKTIVLLEVMFFLLIWGLFLVASTLIS